MNDSNTEVWHKIIGDALTETTFLPRPVDTSALRAIWVRMHQRVQETLDPQLATRFVELTESEQDLITRDHFPFTEFIGIVRSAP